MQNKIQARQLDYLTEDEAYEHLAKSIVIQAIEDYRNALHGKAINRHVNVLKDKTELEIFFKSEWYKMLSDWDGKALIELIKKQEEQNERTLQRNDSNAVSYRDI